MLLNTVSKGLPVTSYFGVIWCFISCIFSRIWGGSYSLSPAIPISWSIISLGLFYLSIKSINYSKHSMHPFLLNVKDLSKDRKASPNCFNFISIWPLLQYTQCSLCGDSASKFNASSYALRFIHLLTISFFGKGRPLLYAFYISPFVFVKMLLVIGRLLDISRPQRYFNSKSISYYFLKEEGYWVKQWINNQSSISVLLFSWVLFILYFSFESLNLSDYLSSYFFFAFIFS